MRVEMKFSLLRNYLKVKIMASRKNHERHPKHLKGREIGLWYSQRMRQKREEQLRENPKSESTDNMEQGTTLLKRIRKNMDKPLLTICSVSFHEDLVREVNEILESSNDKNVKPFSIEFQRYFDSILFTSFDDYIKDELQFLEVFKTEDDKSLELFSNLHEIEENEEYQKKLSIRLKLPVFSKYDEILKEITNNQIVLISGDTGCGKTTQIPQFILDDFIKRKIGAQCNIICTQPRRISAITVAERVAWERNERLGKSVGYQIRLQSIRPRERGSITYCTTGILLRQLESDPLLKSVSHIVLDEVHERDVDTDILIALLKKICPYRKDLKVILMSATFCIEAFSKYFDNCPIIKVHGTLYPVEQFYLEDVLEEMKFNISCNERYKKRRRAFEMKNADDFMEMIGPYARTVSNKYSKLTIGSITNYMSEEFNVDLLRSLIFHITATKPDGAILVFLSGYDQISKLYNEIVNSNFYKVRQMKIYPLHSMMSTAHQKEIFERPPPGCRKVILSTTIAETSITIDDVVYVIDTGKIKMSDYDEKRNIQTLGERWETIANAQQRKGRAGRVQPGICYHLFSRPRELTFDLFPKPEILRTKLDGVILNIKMLRINNVEHFLKTMLNVPSETALENSIILLKRIDALDDYEKLTPLGLHLARLPIDPQMGKMCLMASIFQCIDPITSVAASLSFKDAFYRPLGKEKQVDEIRKKFSNKTHSDHLMFANVIKEYRIAESKKRNGQFCYENFLSKSILNQLEKMKTQFCEILHEARFLHDRNVDSMEDNINSSNRNILQAIICAGLYPNVAFLKKIRKIRNRVDAIHHLITAEDGRVEFHPSSVNFKEGNFESRFFVYYIKQKSTSLYLFDASMIHPLPLLIFADDVKSNVTDGKYYLLIADKFKFSSDEQSSELIMKMRRGLQILLQHKALHPSLIEKGSSDDVLLKAIIHLLTKVNMQSDDEFDFGDDN